MTSPRRHLTYANVVSTLAVLLLLTGGGAALAAGLARNSVGSAQIRSGAVERDELGREAVRSRAVKDGSLTVRDFRAGQLPSTDPFAVVDAAGALLGGRGVAGIRRVGPGNYAVTFDRSIGACGFAATPVVVGLASQPTFASVNVRFDSTVQVYLNAGDPPVPTDRGFHLVASC